MLAMKMTSSKLLVWIAMLVVALSLIVGFTHMISAGIINLPDRDFLVKPVVYETGAFPTGLLSWISQYLEQDIIHIKMPNNTTQVVTRPEQMLPIMIVLGIMFIGICIAMNLFSRARFKKRRNVFAVANRASAQKRSGRGSGPGSSRRLSSYCPSPMPPMGSIVFSNAATGTINQPVSNKDGSGRTSVAKV